ncbi:MAG: Fe-S cluster assembly ATPase SufC [Sphingomonadales bacterium]|jgi:Fe-S cluster assembly ATP-binding protein
MLKIENLHVTVADIKIIKGLNLEIKAGEVHAIMGPNGAGKSTLASTLSGRDKYTVTSGSVTFCEKNLLDLAPHERAGEGLFQGFQYPVEIPGISNMNFLRTALNSTLRYRNEKELDAASFIRLLREKANFLDLDWDMVKRPVNVGFSGGEKKRNEMVQMMVLDPKLAVLDETDSGLDIDAVKVVAKGINSLRAPGKGLLLITHYQRLLDYVVPDYVHVLAGGVITKSGGKELALELEKKGYSDVT